MYLKLFFAALISCALLLGGCGQQPAQNIQDTSDSSESDNNSISSQTSEIQTPSGTSVEERVYFENLSPEDEALYQRLTKERGLKEWQIHSLSSMGLTFQQILELPESEAAEMLAPGSSAMGDRLSEEEFQKLLDSDWNETDVYVLQALGYDYTSITALTPKQIDFILPNTELVGNLVALGYDENVVEAAGFLRAGGWETYKDLLDEVFEKHAEQLNSINNETKITFPFSDKDKTEFNAAIYDIEPFVLSLALPAGWSMKEQDSIEEYRLESVFSRLNLFNENGECVGVVGYNIYEPYEGEKDDPRVVYGQIALGNDYHFNVRDQDSYHVVKETDTGTTATANVYYAAAINNGAEKNNKGIVSYNRDYLVYIAIELSGEKVTDEQVTDIAKSIQISR